VTIIQLLTSVGRSWLARLIWGDSPRLVPVAYLRLATALALASALAFPAGVVAQKKPAHLDNVLRDKIEKSDRGPVRVIVRTVPGKHAQKAAEFEQRGHKQHGQFPLIDGVNLTVGADELEELANDPDVIGVSLDAPIAPDLTTATETGLRKTLALPNYDFGYSVGSGITVAVVDSGLATSTDLSSARLKAFRDFTGGNGAVTVSPTDGYGHGTHVASLIGGTGELSSSLQYQGLAPNVNFVGLRVLDSNGAGLTSSVIAAIEWAITNKAAYGIRIINLSLSHPIYEPAAQDPLVQAVEAAVRAGIVVVASAGNYGMNPETGQTGYAGIASPGNAPSAITVGSLDTKGTETRSDDTVASYSSRGPSWFDAYAKPDIVAPGHRLIGRSASSYSTLAQLLPEQRVYDKYWNKTYLRLSGSSMATAVVSGAVALIMARHDYNFPNAPDLTPNTVKAVLQYTAIPLGSVDNLTQGAGGLNAGAAVEFAGAINTAASSGAYWATGGTYPQTTIAGVTYTWSRSYVWGPYIASSRAILYNYEMWRSDVVWGDARNIVWGDARNIVWGDARNIVWGDARNIVWGDNLVWGDAVNIVWGDSVVWGDARNIVWGDARNIVWGDSIVLWSSGATGSDDLQIDR